MSRLLISHVHRPLYRVVRAGWKDPLDASFSRTAADNRWNSLEFPALYCCCSQLVARAVTRDILRFAGVEMEDLLPAYRPRLVEVDWTGEVVDVVSVEGITAAGFAVAYPDGVPKDLTRRAASEWHQQGDQGVACRSASLWRMGFSEWSGPYSRWSELAIFTRNCRAKPHLVSHRDDLDWLVPEGAGQLTD